MITLHSFQVQIETKKVDLCDMAQDILRSKVKKASKLYDHSKKDLKKVLKELGETEYKGNAYKKMGEIIIKVVREKCDEKCLLLLR